MIRARLNESGNGKNGEVQNGNPKLQDKTIWYKSGKDKVERLMNLGMSKMEGHPSQIM